MVSAEHEPITGVWGQRAEPLVKGQSPWSGGQSPPEAESILVIGCPTEPANLAPVREQYALLRSTGVRVGGGAECMVPPTSSLVGLCPGPLPGSAAYV